MHLRFISIRFLILCSIFMIISVSNNIKAQERRDSCLEITVPDDHFSGTWNRDSVMEDTCQNSTTYRKLYSKVYYSRIKTDNYPINPRPLPLDSGVTWESVDVEYPTLRSGLETLEKVFGPYRIFRDPWDNIDSVHLRFPTFKIIFPFYYLVDDVLGYITKIDFMLDSWSAWFNIEDVKDKPIKKENLSFYPNPADDMLSVKIPDEVMNISSGIKIIDVLGNKVKKENFESYSNELKIDVSSLQVGIYYLIYDMKAYKFVVWR